MSEVVSRVPGIDPSDVGPPRVDPPRVVEYPSSDGKPVAESELHYDRLADVASMLRRRYEQCEDVYVGVNMLVYYERDNKNRHLAPDAFVVFGVPKHRRDVFLLWDEKVPAFILEITSKTTRGDDQNKKRERYADWGVAEYFLYDPRAEYLAPPLQGLALAGGRVPEHAGARAGERRPGPAQPHAGAGPMAARRRAAVVRPGGPRGVVDARGGGGGQGSFRDCPRGCGGRPRGCRGGARSGTRGAAARTRRGLVLG